MMRSHFHIHQSGGSGAEQDTPIAAHNSDRRYGTWHLDGVHTHARARCVFGFAADHDPDFTKSQAMSLSDKRQKQLVRVSPKTPEPCRAWSYTK